MNFTSKRSILNYSLIILLSINFTSCRDDDEVGEIMNIETPTYAATINLKQFVNDSSLQMNTSDFPYINAMNQKFKVTKLQYLVSDFTFHKADNSTFTIEEHHYIDLSNPASLTFNPTTKVPRGDYTSISFTFGFDKEDNDKIYPDLNTVAWNWHSDPTGMFGDLGGGYHFMRLEGDYINVGMSSSDTAQYKTHMGRARNDGVNPITIDDNHIETTLANSSISISADFSFDLEMNIEEWYQNPTTWDFTVWNAPIMPIYNAQRALNANGINVFTFKQ